MLVILRGILLGALCTASGVALTEGSNTSEKGITFSHVYKIDSGCKQAMLLSQDPASESPIMAVDGGNDVVFKHNIQLSSAGCACADSEEFKSLLYRLNGLEEEVTYLKTQCAQGCCAGSPGMDTSCSGHGTYQHDSCSCRCDPGWTGLDCSTSACPEDCNDNGYCVDGHCVCHAGYAGHDCSLLACPDNCSDRGHCVDGHCVCHAGYAGHDCSLLACPDNCSDRGHCVDGRCVCFQGFSGDACTEKRCLGDCTENGRCLDGRCICDEGFFGDDCSMVASPKGLHLVRVTDVSLLVEWEPVRGAEYYVLSYHPEGDAGTAQKVQVLNMENSYLITGLKPAVTYIVQVYAVIKAQKSDADRILATTGVSGVEGIRVLGQTEDSIQVDWQNPENEVDFFKLRHTSPTGHGELENVARSQEARTVHTIVGLNPGTEYQISVQAVRGNSEGKASLASGVTDIDAPTKLIARDITETSAMVTWDRVLAEIHGYVLTYSSAEGSSPEIQIGANATSYQLDSLKPGVLYTIYIWAYKGPQFSRKTSTEVETDLDAPTNVLAREVTEDSLEVSWDRVQADVDGYMLSYSSPHGSSEELQVGADSTSYRLSMLRPGVVYTVYVWAVKGSRYSRKATADAETDIDAPRNLQAVDVQATSAALTWTAPQANIQGYVLHYRPEDGSVRSAEKRLSAGETRYGLSGLAVGKKYIVTVTAYRGTKRSKEVETTFSTVGIVHPFPMDCAQIMENGNTESRVYTIYVSGDRSRPAQVFCDMTTDGGGWIVIQRRNSGKLDFMKRWKQYTQGFGDLNDEFWLGLEKLHELTNTPTQYEVRFDLGLGAERVYAVYDHFQIAPAKQKFKLTVGKYRGNAGDAMTYHQGRPFTTVDSDNDIALGNCALTHRGAWWYKNCHLANLNGKFGDTRHSMGVNWEPWKGHLMSLDFTKIMMRPVGTGSRKKRSPQRRAAA
ncbi:tenascin-N [Electrophorus electricus]|uniref:tenascin-N n=1 Tax=Electrophorus electricus TaxID=8005 RepID=UPI0015D02FE6|nr:tenascin-N [Electrophorus electricus]XP_026867166.2 tenascin-N [Electrophorus electricus]XP_026867167.2 tenascin-N [Electrophorus electricus]